MVTHLLLTYVLTRCSTRCGSTIGCRRRRSVTSGALRSCAACRSARWTSSSRSPPSRAAGKHRHVKRDDRPAFGMASVRPAWRRAGCTLAPREARGGASPSPLLPLTQPPPRASQPLVGRAGRPGRACSRHRCIGNHSFGCFVFGGLPHIWIANGCRGIFACHAASSASPVTQQCGRAGNNNEKLNVCPCEGEL